MARFLFARDDDDENDEEEMSATLNDFAFDDFSLFSSVAFRFVFELVYFLLAHAR